MSGLGSILALASEAAQPLEPAQATCVDLPSTTFPSALDAAGSGGTGAAPSGASSSDYAMAVLAGITRAGADQALALIQELSVAFGK
jgi:hypothetical protein